MSTGVDELPRVAIRPKGARRRRQVREAMLGYALVLPSLLVFGVFVYYPFVRNFYLGFHRAPLFGSGLGEYVGFDQWRTVLDLDTMGPRLLAGLGIGVAVALAALVLVPAFVRALQQSARPPAPGPGPAAHGAWPTPLGAAPPRGWAPPRPAPKPIRTWLWILLRGFSGEAWERLRTWKRLVGAWLAIGAVLGIWLFLGASDTQFSRSLETTFVLYLMTLVPILVLGTLLAVLAHRIMQGIAVFRTLFMMSLATGVGVAGTIFFTFLNPQVGLLPWLGLEANPAPLENPTWARPSVAVFVIWLEIGLAFIVLLAGLQGIPDDLYEAARVDGASAWRRFWRITVPMLSPTLLFVFVIGSIFSLTQSFAYVDITTQGGPLGKTQTLPWVIVDSLRGTSPDRSKAAVLSVALFVIAFVFTLVQLVVLERRVHYGGGER